MTNVDRRWRCKSGEEVVWYGREVRVDDRRGDGGVGVGR